MLQSKPFEEPIFKPSSPKTESKAQTVTEDSRLDLARSSLFLGFILTGLVQVVARLELQHPTLFAPRRLVQAWVQRPENTHWQNSTRKMKSSNIKMPIHSQEENRSDLTKKDDGNSSQPCCEEGGQFKDTNVHTHKQSFPRFPPLVPWNLIPEGTVLRAQETPVPMWQEPDSDLASQAVSQETQGTTTSDSESLGSEVSGAPEANARGKAACVSPGKAASAAEKPGNAPSRTKLSAHAPEFYPTQGFYVVYQWPY